VQNPALANQRSYYSCKSLSRVGSTFQRFELQVGSSFNFSHLPGPVSNLESLKQGYTLLFDQPSSEKESDEG